MQQFFSCRGTILNGRRVRFGHIQRKEYFLFWVSGKSADFPETLFHREGQIGKHLLLVFTTPLVKMRLERSAERDKREI
ncbi:hypothetical protein [Faecalibacterium intestinale]|uniref:hypothetical protein n=1 Tax=Faecalibacterium intestinale TaxID=3133155 RepID=UPI0032C0C951